MYLAYGLIDFRWTGQLLGGTHVVKCRGGTEFDREPEPLGNLVDSLRDHSSGGCASALPI